MVVRLCLEHLHRLPSEVSADVAEIVEAQAFLAIKAEEEEKLLKG